MALFVALGGSAAALQGKDTVRSDDIVDKQVKTQDLKPKAVSSSRLKPGAVKTNRLAPEAVGSDQLAPGAVGPAQLGNGAVTEGKLGPDSVTGENLTDGSLGAADADGSLPIAGFPSGAAGRLELDKGAINFIGEGSNNTPTAETPIGTIELGCEGSEVGASIVLRSTIADEAIVVAIWGNGSGNGIWSLLEPGDSIPGSGEGVLPPGGGHINGAAHVEFRVFGNPQQNGTPRGTVDVFMFHDDPANLCFVLWDSSIYE